jgi:SPP1 gp7 family putative phage head morphogenesis protein
MREKQLKPIEVPLKFDKKVEDQILAFLLENLFSPIIESMELSKSINFNAKTSVIEDAIKSGKIQFSDGIFKGDFNAALTKEFRQLGLKFDKRIKGYRKEINNLPIPLQLTIAQTASNYEKMASRMLSSIDSLVFDEELGGLSFASTYDNIISDIDNKLTKTVGNPLGIQVETSVLQKKVITEEFSNNLKLFIRNFANEQIPILREEVEQAVFAGIRSKSLEKIIIKRFGVSRSKAKFLAKQEIGLFTAKYKESKYKEAGITKYRWSTSGDIRVRAGHKDLNKQVFSFDDPPITDKATGERNNPGEDYGCRCKPIPLISI